MKTPDQIRTEQKFKLWETPGFSQFLEDLQNYMGVEISVHLAANVLKNKYRREMNIVPKTNFKQGKLPFK